MTFRKAAAADLDAAAAIYDRIHTEEEFGRAVIGWDRAIYPVRATAEAALERGDLFVAEEDGEIVASAVINQIQPEAYREADWACDAPPERVMVLHTLTVDPRRSREGIGRRFEAFYEQYALEQGCPFLRIDTNEKNAVARRLYRTLGYAERGIVPTVFNGLPDVNLVCLEKRLPEPVCEE